MGTTGLLFWNGAIASVKLSGYRAVFFSTKSDTNFFELHTHRSTTIFYERYFLIFHTQRSAVQDYATSIYTLLRSCRRNARSSIPICLDSNVPDRRDAVWHTDVLSKGHVAYCMEYAAQ